MTLQKPTLTFELGLTAGFRDALSSVAWTDITPYVLSWDTSRGREPKKPPSHFEPGNANLLLNNRDRRFDPANTASPYSPNLKPARVRLRVRARWMPDLLTPNQKSIETDTTGWAAESNCTIARSTAQKVHGAASLALTASAAGPMVVTTPGGTAGIAVSPGNTYTGLALALAGVGTQNTTVTLRWYNAAGALMAASTGTTVVAGTAGWTQGYVTATAPDGAAYCALVISVIAAAAGNVAYLDRMSVNPGTSQTWAASSDYDVFTGYVKRWPPQWTASATSTLAVTAVDALGAPLNLARIYGTLYETAVRHDKPKVWLRLKDSSGTVALDATSNRIDGQYQGTPTRDLPGLIATETEDKAAQFISGSRVSLPYKNLLASYPFTFECWFTCGTATTVSKMILSAYDGPTADWRQFIQIFISNAGVTSGKIVALVANPYPTGTQVESSITVNDGFPHHLAIVFTSSTNFKIYIDGADRTVSVATNAHAFPNDLITGYAIGNNPSTGHADWHFGDTAADLLAEPAIYDFALSTARISKHYGSGLGYAGLLAASGYHVRRLLAEADWPDYVVADGESSLQNVTVAGSVVANLQKVEESEQGALFVDGAGKVVFQGRYALLSAPYTISQVTLGQGVGDQPYEAPVMWGNDDAELFNEASGSRVGGPTYTVADALSVTYYGERPLSNIDGLWNIDNGQVVDLLAYRVQKYAQPVSSVRQVRLHPAAVAALYPHVLGLGLRSRVTVKVQPPGGGPVFSQESHIERISHEVDGSGDWWTTWDVSAADVASYMVLDDAQRGVLDAGNRTAF